MAFLQLSTCASQASMWRTWQLLRPFVKLVLFSATFTCFLPYFFFCVSFTCTNIEPFFFCSNNAIAQRVLIVLPLKEFFASVGSPKKNYFSGYYFFFFYCCSLLAKHAGAALGCLLLWVFSVSCTQLVNGLLLFLFLFFLLWFRRGVKSLRYRRVAPRPDLHLFFFFTLFLFLSFLFLVLSKTFLFSFSFLIAGVSPPLPPFFTRW